MNATEQKVKVGDVVICRWRYGDKPQTANVSKVTPKGWLRITGADGKECGPFKPVSYRTGEYTSVGGYSDRTIWLHSDETMTRLNKEHEEKVQGDKERQEERDRSRKERDDRLQKELAEVKEACGGKLNAATMNCPDGSKIVTLEIPVKPEYSERKKGYEVAIVRLKDVEDYDWRSKETKKVKKVEMFLTYANGNTQSWASCSGQKFDTDEEALWEAVRYCYHNGW